MAKKGAITHSLAKLFPNQTVLDVLALLLLNPEQEYYQREIAEKTQSTTVEVQRALRRIQAAGLVLKTRRGNRVYYVACREHPAYEDLKRVLIKTVALGDQLRAALRPFEARVLLAFVYGSVAEGSEGATSDIDLLLVGQLSQRQAAGVLGPLGRDLGREFNATIYPEKEFRAKARKGNRFIQQVVAGPKIWLIGDEKELTRLAE